MFNSALNIVTYVAFIGVALAQSSALDSLSTSCKNAVSALSEDANASACLGIADFEAIADLIVANSTNSLVVPVNTWLTNLCAASECTESTLQSVVEKLQTGCEIELPYETAAFYPAIRKALCFQQETTNCVTQTLANIEKVLGTFDVAKYRSILSLDENITGTLANETSIYCTDCTRNIASALAEATVPEPAQINLSPVLEMQCGESFLSGTPTTSGASSTATTESSAMGSASLLSRGVFSTIAASSLVAFWTMFVSLV